jgi:hypothetical protein
MQLQADVKCYHCGRVSGTWHWLAAAGPSWGSFQRTGHAGRVRMDLTHLHCAHCGGPVFLDEVDEVRTPHVLAFERPRLGRPPKEAPRRAS